MAPKKEQKPLTQRQRAERMVRRRIIRTVLIAVIGFGLFIAVVAVLYNASNKGDNGDAVVTAEPTRVASSTAETQIAQNSDYARADDPIATITMANGGMIEIELYPAAAPNTVANFVELANAGYYDGLLFHRVISDFMIQGGDPDGDGTGGPDYAIKGEFSKNGVDNQLTHTRGVISMAHSNDYDTAGSQFFIVHADSTFLDGQYAAFGEVLSGMAVVDQIAAVSVGENDKPLDDVVIASISVDTKGVEYKAEKIED